MAHAHNINRCCSFQPTQRHENTLYWGAIALALFYQSIRQLCAHNTIALHCCHDALVCNTPRLRSFPLWLICFMWRAEAHDWMTQSTTKREALLLDSKLCKVSAEELLSHLYVHSGRLLWKHTQQQYYLTLCGFRWLQVVYDCSRLLADWLKHGQPQLCLALSCQIPLAWDKKLAWASFTHSPMDSSAWAHALDVTKYQSAKMHRTYVGAHNDIVLCNYYQHPYPCK